MALAPGSASHPALGIRENWRQFALLVLVNAFVGAMIGLERTVLPLLAEREFALASKSATLSFIATFGIVKAVTNLLAGRLGDRFGRKPILLAGWLAALPVPLLVIWAPTWSWIVFANVLLGINQGLAWSMTVIMKIDLVGPKRRGLAMGLNEFAGYLAVAAAAYATGEVASRYGLRPEPFYLGIAFAVAGLALSLLFVRETLGHVSHASSPDVTGPAPLRYERRTLSAANSIGLVNNLNDGLAWGLFPIFFATAGLSVRDVGLLASSYPAAWGIAQLWTGHLSDRMGRKWLIAGGMALQGIALLAIAATRGLPMWLASSLLLGLGTAMVYPTLLALIGDVAQPSWRARAVGTYRFWRDLGYVAGALVAGALADAFGMAAAITAIGALTMMSGVHAAVSLSETLSYAARRKEPSARGPTAR